MRPDDSGAGPADTHMSDTRLLDTRTAGTRTAGTRVFGTRPADACTAGADRTSTRNGGH